MLCKFLFGKNNWIHILNNLSWVCEEICNGNFEIEKYVAYMLTALGWTCFWNEACMMISWEETNSKILDLFGTLNIGYWGKIPYFPQYPIFWDHLSNATNFQHNLLKINCVDMDLKNVLKNCTRDHHTFNINTFKDARWAEIISCS